MRSKLFVLAMMLTASTVTGGSAAATAENVTLASPQLTDQHVCAGQPGFTCSTLTVPLDYHGKSPGTLKLQVAMGDNADAPKGVLFFLTGGPGQPGVPAISRIAQLRLPEVAKDYRFVMLDQRGTGEFGAINCPALQAQTGSSDIAAPTPDAVAQCASILGDNAPFYGTDETVADLDLLRRALGVEKMVVDGVSYGSFTAARYAIAHPRNVEKVVLDSVLPHHATAESSLALIGMRAEARVLRDACATPPACGFDPAEDLAWVVRHRDPAGGVALFDMIVTYEFIDPTYRNPAPPNFPPVGDLVGALHSARNGDSTKLDLLLSILAPGGDDVTHFSSGLHAAALCADQRFPWGTPATPTQLRTPLLELAKRRLTESDVWPYTQEVAVNQGFIKTCQHWPAEPPTPNPAGKLPNVPVLLLNGDRDLSTPLEWAEAEAAVAPLGNLVVVQGASHSIQNRELGHAGRDAVIDFLKN
jgi:pimeloyl-ACP methyl ester carboxylesterase